MKKMIDILGILLPFLLMLLGFSKLFGSRREKFAGRAKMLNALVLLFTVTLFFAGLIRYVFYSNSVVHESGPKAVPLSVSKHSEAFNLSLEKAMENYYNMTSGFMQSDTTAINTAAATLKASLDSVKIDELKKDTLIYLTALDPLTNSKGEVESILKDPSIDEKRGSLNILSDALKTFLITVKYDRAKIYWQEAPSAFGEDKPGNWLSPSPQSKNPYPGKDVKDGNEPSKIDTKDSINFIPTDTTKK